VLAATASLIALSSTMERLFPGLVSRKELIRRGLWNMLYMNYVI
jgi:hypothetical protein